MGHGSWASVIDQLDLRTDGAHIQPTQILRGYRSTQPILDFAKHLLPRDERHAQSLQQEGPAPTVVRVRNPDARNVRIIQEVERLTTTYERGTAAVIVLKSDLEAVETAFLKAGWTRRPQHSWKRQGMRVRIVTPTTARGVEFDAVIVVEPGDFPRNLGRVGQLYTSLTRANRELAVVHSRPLPDEFRRFNRSR